MELIKAGQKTKGKGGPFISFILLNESTFSAEKLVKDLKNDWNIDVSDDDINDKEDVFIFTVDGMMTTVCLMPMPIPNDEAVNCAKTNFRWPNAVSVAKLHKAHLLVSVLSKDQSPIQAGSAMVKVCSSCLKQKTAVAINTLETVFSPDFYIQCAEQYLHNNAFPIMNLVFFGVYSQSTENKICGYTYGMKYFYKSELEIIDSSRSVEEVVNFLISTASYVIEYDVLLQDGETIGFSDAERHPIRKSEGIAVDGQTLKISF